MMSRVSLVAKNASPQCHLSFLTGEDSTQTEEKLALKTYYLIGQTLSLNFPLAQYCLSSKNNHWLVVHQGCSIYRFTY